MVKIGFDLFGIAIESGAGFMKNLELQHIRSFSYLNGLVECLDFLCQLDTY